MSTRNKVRARKRKKEGGGRELKKKIKPRESVTHQLITEILFLSKEKTGLKHPIKERMKGNLLFLIHIGSSFEVLPSDKFLHFSHAALMIHFHCSRIGGSFLKLTRFVA